MIAAVAGAASMDEACRNPELLENPALSYAALQHGKTVGMFSLEMSHQQLFLRMLCSEGQIDGHRLKTGRVNREDWQRILLVDAPLSPLRTGRQPRVEDRDSYQLPD